jgi:hypothetical protein
MVGRLKDWPAAGKAVPPDCCLILLIGCHSLRPALKSLPLHRRTRRDRHLLVMMREQFLTLGVTSAKRAP